MAHLTGAELGVRVSGLGGRFVELIQSPRVVL